MKQDSQTDSIDTQTLKAITTSVVSTSRRCCHTSMTANRSINLKFSLSSLNTRRECENKKNGAEKGQKQLANGLCLDSGAINLHLEQGMKEQPNDYWFCHQPARRTISKASKNELSSQRGCRIEIDFSSILAASFRDFSTFPANEIHKFCFRLFLRGCQKQESLNSCRYFGRNCECRGWKPWQSVTIAKRHRHQRRLRQHQHRPFSHQICAASPAARSIHSIPATFQTCIRRLATSCPSGSKDWVCDVPRIWMFIKRLTPSGWWAIQRRLVFVSVACCVARMIIVPRWIILSNWPRKLRYSFLGWKLACFCWIFRECSEFLYFGRFRSFYKQFSHISLSTLPWSPKSSSSLQQTSTPLIVGDTNPSTLATNLLFLYHPCPQIKIKSRIQTGAFPYASGFRSSTAVLEYLAKSSTVSLAIHDPKRDSCRMTIGFLHSFNKNFCAGLEVLAGWRAWSPMEANVAFAGRFVR